MRKIKIRTKEIEVLAELNDSRTAKLIWDALPLKGITNTWGDEIYFSIPVSAEIENPKSVVEMGDLGYWPPGNAFCIFFGKTPTSTETEIRPASPVCVVGELCGNPEELKKVRAGETIILEKA
ncbi:MAG TPA: hypothetical protein EYP60_00735 [bacterium (Candidatus Stahlbacteria)]|nr:hypothetical protein [Candidatus Stahlbacteria bacterium]